MHVKMIRSTMIFTPPHTQSIVYTYMKTISYTDRYVNTNIT